MVADTVLSIREQIRQAILESLSAIGTPVPTFVEYGPYKDQTKYPLIKAYYVANDDLVREYMATRSLQKTQLVIEVAPWCTQNTAEYETSKIIEILPSHILTEDIKLLVADAYKGKVGKITPTRSTLIGTSLPNPYLCVRFMCDVDYML